MDGRTIEARFKLTTVTVRAFIEYTANKPILIPVVHQEVLAEVRLPVTQPRTTLVAVHRSLRQHRSTLRLRLARASPQLRPIRLRLAQATAQRHRLTRPLRLEHLMAQATARLPRLTLTPRGLLVTQLALADQRLRTATPPLWFTSG